jgi:hypothetical protein
MKHSLNANPDLQADITVGLDARRNRRMSVADTATYLNLSQSTLNKMRLTGSGPVYSKLGRRVLYELCDINDWTARNKRRHTSEMA